MYKRFLVLSLSVLMGLFLTLGSSILFSPSHANAQMRPVTPGAQVRPVSPTPPRPSGSMGGQMNAPSQAGQVNAIDIAFLKEASQAGLAFIQLSQLALEKSSNPQVQQFAQSEIDEQQQNAADFRRIAPTLDVRLGPNIPERYRAAYSRLSQLSGAEFDNAFLDEGGINSHLEAASVFQREAAFGQNPDLLAVANRGLSIINQHFTIASQLTDYQFAQVPRRYSGQTALENPSSPRSTTNQ